MWCVNYPKLLKKIYEVFGELHYSEYAIERWKSGEKATMKAIVQLENDLDIDFKDYIIVKREPKTMRARLKFMREINGFTQGELGDELGFDYSTVKRMERQDELTEDRIFELNELFGCQTTFFKKGGEPYADKKIFS